MNDYNVLAKFLTDKYIDRVSGRDFPERIVGEDPDKVVMAGTMQRIETKKLLRVVIERIYQNNLKVFRLSVCRFT